MEIGAIIELAQFSAGAAAALWQLIDKLQAAGRNKATPEEIAAVRQAAMQHQAEAEKRWAELAPDAGVAKVMAGGTVFREPAKTETPSDANELHQ